jgi:hypothetical protein
MKKTPIVLAFLATILSTNAFAQSCTATAAELTAAEITRCGGTFVDNRGSTLNPNAPTSIASVFNTASQPGLGPIGLLTHPLNNFATQTQISTNNSSSIITADFDPTGTTLFAIRNTAADKSLGTLNRTTGVYTATAVITGLTNTTENISDLTVSPSSGQGFIITNDGTAAPFTARLYRINTATAVATIVGAVSTTDLVTGIAMNCNGQLFGVNVVNDQLISINPTTAVATNIGLTGYNHNFSQGMDFDNETNELYGWAIGGAAGAFTFQYGTYNLTTGALSNNASTNGNQAKGAIPTSCPGTTPAAITLIKRAVPGTTADADLQTACAAASSTITLPVFGGSVRYCYRVTAAATGATSTQHRITDPQFGAAPFADFPFTLAAGATSPFIGSAAFNTATTVQTNATWQACSGAVCTTANSVTSTASGGAVVGAVQAPALSTFGALGMILALGGLALVGVRRFS